MNEFRLPSIPPFGWDRLIAFLSARATPGVESVTDGTYRRTFQGGGTSGTIEANHDPVRNELVVRTSHRSGQPRLEHRIRRLFDLDANSSAISQAFAEDPLLAPLVTDFAGIRVPGSWDPFETAVRAIIGQVVSVKVATTLTGRLVARLGQPVAIPHGSLTLLHPTPELLAEADLSGIGLSNQKIGSIRALARAVAGRELRFDELEDLDDALERLQALQGIGPWTAHYIAMRGLGQPDAFPAGDLILRRAASPEGGTLSEKELESLSQQWRPYRAYAAMLLWASYARNMDIRPSRGSA